MSPIALKKIALPIQVVLLTLPFDKGVVIGIVGPCGAGKTTLAQGLVERGYHARPIAQEHSFVPTMWQQITHPDILIFLQASHLVCARRKKFSWTKAEWAEQQKRLANAYAHAHIKIDTDPLTINEVLDIVIAHLKR